MKKFIFSLLFVVCSLWSSARAAETLELLTYYPAPYGVYQNLKATQKLWVGTSAGLPLSGGNGLLQSGGTTAFNCAIYGFGADLIGVIGYSTNKTGVYGYSDTENAVYGYSPNNYGVVGKSDNAAYGGVFGTSAVAYGVVGASTDAPGVSGQSVNQAGVSGTSTNKYGVAASNLNDGGLTDINRSGLYAESNRGCGVRAKSINYIAIWGGDYGTAGGGILGRSGTGTGVSGDSEHGIGVYGTCIDNHGVYGEITTANAVAGKAGVYGKGNANVGVYGTSTSGFAGEFNGTVLISGTSKLRLNPGGSFGPQANAQSTIYFYTRNIADNTPLDHKFVPTTANYGYIGDAANYWYRIYNNIYYGKTTTISSFDIAEEYPVLDETIEAGDVVYLMPTNNSKIIKYFDEEKKYTNTKQNEKTKEEKVIQDSLTQRNTVDGTILEKVSKTDIINIIGVISTKPAVKMGSWQPNPDVPTRYLALAGRAPVKVNLENGTIKAGDLITTSSAPGIGAKAIKSGLVLGMALESIDTIGDGSYAKILAFINPHYSLSSSAETTSLDETADTIKKLKTKVEQLEKEINIVKNNK